MVKAWILIHEIELKALWKEIKNNGNYFKNKPLKGGIIMINEKEIKVIRSIPKDNYILECTFNNGIKKAYDIKPLFKNKIFSKLKDNNKFMQIKVDKGGYGISWDDEI